MATAIRRPAAGLAAGRAPSRTAAQDQRCASRISHCPDPGKPASWRHETFKLSTDPLFIDKVPDIAGLYLAPPARAVVLCGDEKSQIQALDRTQPLLLSFGVAGVKKWGQKRS